MKKSKTQYNTIHDIRLAKERHRYETILYRDKFWNTTNIILTDLSLDVKNMGLDIRSKLFTYSLFRSIFKTSMLIGFARSFSKFFQHSR